MTKFKLGMAAAAAAVLAFGVAACGQTTSTPEEAPPAAEAPAAPEAAPAAEAPVDPAAAPAEGAAPAAPAPATTP